LKTLIAILIDILVLLRDAILLKEVKLGRDKSCFDKIRPATLSGVIVPGA
jgi:hypothetical protein